MNKTVLQVFGALVAIAALFSCSQTIDDLPENNIVGKWEYSQLAWDSVRGNYKATREAISKDLKNKWSQVESGAFTYEFTSDNLFLYNNEVRGTYTFTGSGLLIESIDPDNGAYHDEGSLQFRMIGNQLYVIHNYASLYRNKETGLGDPEILRSIGVTANLDKDQHIYGAWVGLLFNPIQ